MDHFQHYILFLKPFSVSSFTFVFFTDYLTLLRAIRRKNLQTIGHVIFVLIFLFCKTLQLLYLHFSKNLSLETRLLFCDLVSFVIHKRFNIDTVSLLVGLICTLLLLIFKESETPNNCLLAEIVLKNDKKFCKFFGFCKQQNYKKLQNIIKQKMQFIFNCCHTLLFSFGNKDYMSIFTLLTFFVFRVNHFAFIPAHLLYLL